MSHPESRHRAPLLALLLAGGGLASMLFVPGWLPAVAVAAVALLAGSAVARRRSRRLVFAVVLVAVLLAVGLAGAWLLRARPTAGLSWTLLVLFALPLPVVPWLYWLTFDNGVRGPGSGVREEVGSSIDRPQQLRRENPGDETVTTRQCGALDPEPGFPAPVPGRSGPDPGSRSPVPGTEGGR